MEDDLKKNKMDDDLKKNGRLSPKKMKDDLNKKQTTTQTFKALPGKL